MEGALIGTGRVAEVYADGDDVLKLYAAGIGPEQAEREAAVLDALRATPLLVPKALGVVQMEGRWGLRMTRMPGAQLDLSAAAAPAMADTHVQVHRQSTPGLPSLKARLAERIAQAMLLNSGDKAFLLDLLARLPDDSRLCHGDFHPANIIGAGDRLAIIDWLDAAAGPPAADVARTYLLARHHFADLAEPYLTAYLALGTVDRSAVMAWLPVIAAARLAETVPDEEDRLLVLARGAG